MLHLDLYGHHTISHMIFPLNTASDELVKACRINVRRTYSYLPASHDVHLVSPSKGIPDHFHRVNRLHARRPVAIHTL